jgi:hypothetical protein
MRNVIRILALLLLELSDVQAAAAHCKWWLQQSLATLLCYTHIFFSFFK